MSKFQYVQQDVSVKIKIIFRILLLSHFFFFFFLLSNILDTAPGLLQSCGIIKFYYMSMDL